MEFNSRRADVVECPRLKPCWILLSGRCWSSIGRSSFSMILMAGHRTEMGWYDFESDGILPVLRAGRTLDIFQMAGISLVASGKSGPALAGTENRLVA